MNWHLFKRISVTLLLGFLVVLLVSGTANPVQAEGSSADQDHFVQLPLILSNYSPTPVVTDEVVVLSSSFIQATSTSLQIVGEVQNLTSSIVSTVFVYVNLKDAAGNTLANPGNMTVVAKIAPNMKSPFRITATIPAGYDHYEIDKVIWFTSTITPVALDITNQVQSWNGDSYVVSGSVHNQTAETRTSVEASVTMYDSSGKVIGMGYSKTDPADIEAGQDANFNIEIYFWAGKPDKTKVASYALQVLDD